MHDDRHAVLAFNSVELGRAGGGGEGQPEAVAGAVVVVMLQDAASQVAISGDDVPEQHAAFIFIVDAFVEPGAAIDIEEQGIMGTLEVTKPGQFALAGMGEALQPDGLKIVGAGKVDHAQAEAVVEHRRQDQRAGLRRGEGSRFQPVAMIGLAVAALVVGRAEQDRLAAAVQ